MVSKVIFFPRKTTCTYTKGQTIGGYVLQKKNERKEEYGSEWNAENIFFC